MADTGTIKQAIAQAAFEAAMAVVFVICEGEKRQNIHPKEIGESEATMHRMEPSLRHPVNQSAKYK